MIEAELDTADTRKMVSIHDPSIDKEASANLDEYERSRNLADITLNGEPTWFVMRPVSESEWVMLVRDVRESMRVMDELFRMACVGISNLTRGGKPVPYRTEEVPGYGRRLHQQTFLAVPFQVRQELGFWVWHVSVEVPEESRKNSLALTR